MSVWSSSTSTKFAREPSIVQLQASTPVPLRSRCLGTPVNTSQKLKRKSGGALRSIPSISRRSAFIHAVPANSYFCLFGPTGHSGAWQMIGARDEREFFEAGPILPVALPFLVPQKTREILTIGFHQRVGNVVIAFRRHNEVAAIAGHDMRAEILIRLRIGAVPGVAVEGDQRAGRRFDRHANFLVRTAHHLGQLDGGRMAAITMAAGHHRKRAARFG